ncbi:fimbrial protein [Serratia rubidaea]|uniref:fimbrial protein n=1 Tax=Serratia rubidaea TaxID=61652 RepID=UPI0017828D4B|nr:fimbrial protein [Serratia rubidaea]MBD8453706.1 fimbrial protein [Serratia rubidaea]MDK1705203.1 fimbrial protein [Serratia rubidaea]UJD81865.1 type 1 fimbrial protein [Serratia rubidaea]UJD86428.1 type 1 fimbrial protein [Serratia rubidaea]HDJ1441329.1 fimbrial protein [Serratia rubidaea]
MKLSHVSLAALMAAATLSFGANAAAYEGNSGKVTFHGQVVDSPCNLAPGQDGMDVKVDFGQLSQSQLNDGVKTPGPFAIKLQNCGLGEAENKKSVEITFNSPDQISGKNLLKTNGMATGLGISIETVTFGTALPLVGLADGDNTLSFTAFAQKADPAADVTPGDFSATTNFLISYK